MLEIKEQEISLEAERTPLPDDMNKYHKRIDDLIEDAEIEAEIEAEKKIRSKNSRMLSISIIGLGLLGLVYFQVNHQPSTSTVEPANETQVKKPETAEERLAKQVPLVEDGSVASKLPIPPSTNITKPLNNPFIAPPKNKNSTTPAKIKKPEKPANKKKVSQVTKPKSSAKPTPPISKNESAKFFIQVGAFGVKKNANSFLKKLKGKGFSPSIQTRSQKSNQHVVMVGNFSNKKSGNRTLKELTGKGFNASYYKNPKGSYSLQVGQFNSLKDAQKLQDGLSLKGFLSDTRKLNVPAKTYIVQLGVFPSREKALLTQKKLTRAGFPKTFLR